MAGLMCRRSQQRESTRHVGWECFGDLLGDAELLDEDPPTLRIADFGRCHGVVGGDGDLVLAAEGHDGVGEAAADEEGVVEDAELLR